jgi:Flp pilus assembly CpaF family ATPase/Fe-S-cluster-containing hydrogenase component 2
MKYCPHNLELNALKCIHCDPEKAPCMLACKQDAFYRVTERVLAIDESKCDGCGACLEACPHAAIVIKDGKARKCDLCASYNFEIACVKECKYGAIKVIKTKQELRELEKLLGWRCFELGKSIEKIYRERPRIVEANGERWYILSIPELSSEEARLLKGVLEKFQNNGYNEKDVERALAEYCKENLIALEREQKGYIKGLLKSMAESFGPLDELLKDEELEEITLIGLGKEKPVRVFHQRFGWCNCNLYFTSEDAVRALVNKMLRKSERRLTLNNPCVNGTLPDGSRINATLPPVSLAEPTFTIRKFNVKHFTPIELIRNGTFSAELMAFLWCALQTDCSMVVAGNTGSGKTTSLNALFSFVPAEERIVVIEETPELCVPHKHVVKLMVCKEKGIEMHHLIENSLRMRPDRVVVSEIRTSEETKAFINTLLAGQGKGSYTTFHANSASEAIKRLEFLGIKRIDIASIDLLLVQRRWPVVKREGTFEERRIIEVAELDYAEPKINMLYRFDYKKAKLIRVGKSARLYEKIERTFGKDAEKLIQERKKALEKLVKTRAQCSQNLSELLEGLGHEAA